MYWYYIIGLSILLVFTKDIEHPKIDMKTIKLLSKLIQKRGLSHVLKLNQLLLGFIFVLIGVCLLLGVQPLLK